ncbi:hypothetical protein NHQ30_007199 [Ciborinia camelliae]|nr:hypothetical protein NHQ30_007199 [Ciborinia camelliae]
MAEAAVAAVGLGASVISFIGLTGQILQGCQFVCDYLDDIKGAPKELQYILDHLKIFEGEIRNFKYNLERAGKSIDILPLEEAIERSLKLSESVIEDLRDLVNKYKHDGKKDWWKGFKFAKKKKVFSNYVHRLDSARIGVIGAQLNLSNAFSFAQGEIQQTVLATVSMQSRSNISTTVTTPSHQSSNGEITQTDRQACRDITNAVHDSLDAVLDPISARIVKSGVEMALKDFISNPKPDTAAQSLRKDWPKNFESPTDDCCETFFGGINRPRVIGQTTTMKIINAWLATIVIQSTTTTLQEICEDNGTPEESLVTSKTTYKIDIRPNYLIQARYLVFLEQRTGSVFACSDMQLRCYNDVPYDSPIVKACEAGDLFMVRKLFSEGKATPYDVITELDPRRSLGTADDIPYFDYVSSLLRLVWDVCRNNVRVYSWSRLTPNDPDHNISTMLTRVGNLLQVLEYLVEQGLDPGGSISTRESPTSSNLSLFWDVICALPDCHYLMFPHLQKLIKLIMKKSKSDPFGYIEGREGIIHLRLFFVIVCQDPPTFYQSEGIWPFEPTYSLENAHELKYSEQIVLEFDFDYLQEHPQSLLYDPQGQYIQGFLRFFKCTDAAMESYCIQILDDGLFEHGPENYQLAVKVRISQCLRAGMKLNHTNQRKRINNGRTLCSECRNLGQLDFLRSILHDTGYKDLEIDAIFEESNFIMLEASLDSIRPSKIIEQIINARKPYSIKYEYLVEGKALMLDPGYQRFFPNEEIPDIDFSIFKDDTKKWKEETLSRCTVTWRTEDDYILVSVLPQESQAILRKDLGLSN